MTIKRWKQIIKEIEETGTYRTGHGGKIDFFSSNSYTTKESKIEYCNKMINLLKTENMNYNKDVGEFMLGAKQSIAGTPNINDTRVNELRVNLLEEEVGELKQALNDGNVVEALDALVDIQYVLSGAINQLGFLQTFDLAFNKVHSNNMTKFPKTESEALESVSFHVQDGTPCHCEYNLEIDRWVILRNSDNKVLKPKGYKPVSLKEFVK